MGRKRKKQDLSNYDPESKEYWDKLLRNEGLSMDAGRDPGHRKLIYVGGWKQLESLESKGYTDDKED